MSVKRSSRTTGQGIHGEPAYVLHRYEWSEASLILELFTRNLGRVAVAAKGVRRPASSFRSVLLPFQPLLVSLGPDAQIRVLRGTEWAGGYAMPTGEPLLIGYYMNELLMRLLPRDDAQPLVFDAYAQALAVVASPCSEKLWEPMLRVLELILLRALGVLPALDLETLTLQPLRADRNYTLDPVSGLIAQHERNPTSSATSNLKALTAQQWQHIQLALDSEDVPHALALAVSAVTPELKAMLRAILHHQTGGQVFKTRQLMQSLQKRH